MSEAPFKPKKGTFAARAAILALFALSLYLLFLVLKPFLSGISWATFLVTAFYPLHKMIEKEVGDSSWRASVLSTLLVTTVIVLPVGYLTLKLGSSVGLASQFVQHKILSLDSYGRGSDVWAQFETLKENLSPYIDFSAFDLKKILVDSFQRGLNFVAQGTAPFLQNIFSTLLGFFVTVATMGVLFKEGRTVLVACRDALPLQESDKHAVVQRLLEVSRAVFYGIMMTAAVQAVLGTIGWAIVGLPEPLTFGLLMFFAAFIPFGGTALIWAPGAIYLFIKGSVVKCIVLAAWGTFVVSMIDNFLKPLFISGRGRLPILLVFFGVFGGLAAFGLSGIFLGPLVITFFLVLVEIVKRDLFLTPSER